MPGTSARRSTTSMDTAGKTKPSFTLVCEGGECFKQPMNSKKSVPKKSASKCDTGKCLPNYESDSTDSYDSHDSDSDCSCSECEVVSDSTSDSNSESSDSEGSSSEYSDASQGSIDSVVEFLDSGAYHRAIAECQKKAMMKKKELKRKTNIVGSKKEEGNRRKLLKKKAQRKMPKRLEVQTKSPSPKSPMKCLPSESCF